jgi:uncharacterized protein involved in exopolysaccharide biosynthesis
MNDVDRTQQEAAATIERVNDLLGKGKEMVARGSALLAEVGLQPGELRERILKTGPEAQKLLEQDEQALRDEIERDLPKTPEPTRHVRLRPTRQIV